MKTPRLPKLKGVAPMSLKLSPLEAPPGPYALRIRGKVSAKGVDLDPKPMLEQKIVPFPRGKAVGDSKPKKRRR